MYLQKKGTDNPHDKGYKRIFSIKKNFLDFIKKYIGLEWMMALEDDLSSGKSCMMQSSFVPRYARQWA